MSVGEISSKFYTLMNLVYELSFLLLTSLQLYGERLLLIIYCLLLSGLMTLWYCLLLAAAIEVLW